MCFLDIRTLSHGGKRGSGGLIIYIWKHLHVISLELVKIEDYVRLQLKTVGNHFPMFVGECYILPKGSTGAAANLSPQWFMLSEVSHFSNRGNVTLVDDFNARVAGLQSQCLSQDKTMETC